MRSWTYKARILLPVAVAGTLFLPGCGADLAAPAAELTCVDPPEQNWSDNEKAAFKRDAERAIQQMKGYKKVSVVFSDPSPWLGLTVTATPNGGRPIKVQVGVSDWEYKAHKASTGMGPLDYAVQSWPLSPRSWSVSIVPSQAETKGLIEGLAASWDVTSCANEVRLTVHRPPGRELSLDETVSPDWIEGVAVDYATNTKGDGCSIYNQVGARGMDTDTPAARLVATLHLVVKIAAAPSTAQWPAALRQYFEKLKAGEIPVQIQRRMRLRGGCGG